MAPSSGFIGTLGFLGLVLAGISTTGFIVSFLLPRKRK
jgi:ubiquinone biosynthesis protein